MEYREYKLKEIMYNFKYGTMPKKEKIKSFEEGKYPIYTGYLISGYYDECNIENETLIVVARGVGGTGDVKLTTKKCFLTNLSIAMFNDEKIVSNKYLYYYFKIHNLRYLDSGSAQSQITINDLKNVKVPVPKRDIQDKIVKILSQLDIKIKLNNQINDNLFELGDTLYKEYYSKYENELPNGYKYLNLNDVSVNYDSKRKPMSSREREQHKGEYPYYGATSIIDYVDDYIFDDTYLLMGEDGTVKTAEGYPVLQYIWGKNWINNHAHVLQGTIISTEHLMFALRKKNIEALITGAVQPKINQVNMNKIKIIIGTDDVNKKFEEEIKVIVAKIKVNLIENETLTQIRDTLLPKLMNGEIDLGKIEI